MSKARRPAGVEGAFPPQMVENQRFAVLKDVNRAWRDVVRSFGFDVDRHGRTRPLARLTRRSTGKPAVPVQHYRRWTRDEVSSLRGLLGRGCPIEAVALELKRTTDSIKSKAFLLGLIVADRQPTSRLARHNATTAGTSPD